MRANVFTLFNAIVFACFGILFVIGRWQDALFGFAAIGNAVIGSFQEFRAKRALDRLALLNAAQARVRRDGAEVEIPPGEVVEDDILVLRAGDQIPADAEVVTARGLQVDESMLTGESDAVDKLPGTEVLSGSIVVAGEGAARVTKVGADSYANRFADEAKKFSLMRSELRSSIDRVLRWVSFAIAPVGILAAPDANATARVLADAFPDADRLRPTATIPFSSARKWSAVSEAGGTWVMGAPEMVFGDAATDDTGDFGRRVTELAATGRRTLVLAHAPASLTPAEAEAETLPAGLVPVVLLTFREQIRPDAAQTLEYFREQGVSIRIISGDNPRTVAAIAREVGLDVAEGYDARTLPTDEAELGEILDAHQVFGRVTPAQKKGMVTALQARGHTVAMTGDGVNDALAIKTADIGIAMNSGAAATKAVARLVLLDGQFSHLPAVVAQGRQVIANIERVSMLFLTKTVYATTLAVVFGALLLEFPFLPRQLSITDGLTIGIPAFFLALMPNARRYVPGFLPRSLSFAVPAGLIIATGLTTYSLLARSLEVPQPQLRTGTTIILAIVGIWVLAVLSRPLNRYKVLIVGAMFVGLVIIFTVPLSTAFFDLRDPGEDAAVLLTLVAIPMIAAIEVVRFFHRRFLTRALAAAGLDSATAPASTPPAVTVAAVLAYVAALVATGLGLIVLLARYDVPDDDVLRVSLLGAGIALFGLMILAAAAGMRRGSGLSRLLVSVYLVIVVGLTVLVLADSRLSNLWATGVAVIGVVAIVLPWLPPASRFFSRLRDSSMTA